MGSNEKNRDPFEKLNLEVWASTLQSIASQTRRRARTRPLLVKHQAYYKMDDNIKQEEIPIRNAVFVLKKKESYQVN